MRHGLKGKKLNRTSGERKALLSNLAVSLFHYEQLKTTLPKAKALAPFAEKLITLGKKGNLANRRKIISILHQADAPTKLISVLAPRYKDRNGGYTRIIKSGYRYGDNAPMAIIELVDRDLNAKRNVASSGSH